MQSGSTVPSAFDRTLERLLSRQNPHSLFLGCAAILLAGTIVVDLLLHRDTIDPLISSILILGTGGLGSAAFYFGKRVPIWVGMTAIGLFAVASLYFLSSLGDEQSAVSTLQELPILALYLAWFVAPPFSRAIMLLALLCCSLVLWSNPAFDSDGSLGPSVAVQGLLVALCCFEIGSVLWRRSHSRVTIDPLTGALTRLAFMDQLEAGLARSQRNGTPLSLVVIDFDRFKELNDAHGHAAGDAALSETIALWKHELRAKDLVGRTGGDEFAIVFEHTEHPEAQRIMRRLRERSAHPWSWGIAESRPDDDLETLFTRADDLLYRRKRERS